VGKFIKELVGEDGEKGDKNNLW